MILGSLETLDNEKKGSSGLKVPVDHHDVG